MAQILDPLPANSLNNILCCYVNATSQIQIARISNISNWYFERVVFPGQRLVFESVVGASLEIHTGMMASSILSDRIPCDRLQINEGPYSSLSKTEQSIPKSVALPRRRKSSSLKPAAALSSVD